MNEATALPAHGDTAAAVAADGVFPDLDYFRGRVALAAILEGLGISPGDEVALQAFTCVAVPEGILAVGAIPLWIDVVRGGVTMSAVDLAQKLTSRTRAIIVQHTFGIPASMGPIMKVAAERGCPVIEDCCHTFASSYSGRRVGTFGVASFYSYEWGKPIVAGVGGGVRVNDTSLLGRMQARHGRYAEPPLTSRLRIEASRLAHHFLYRPGIYWQARAAFRWAGRHGLAVQSYNPVAGQLSMDFSQRMAARNRALLRRALVGLPGDTVMRKRVTEQYLQALANREATLPVIEKDANPVFARLPVIVADKARVLEQAKTAHVEVADWYASPVHPLAEPEWPLVSYKAGCCPSSEDMARKCVSLPINRWVTPDVIAATARLFAKRPI